ncbi:MAG: outer membrane protein [Candidatus Nucleicultricaceae bacterium]
MMKKTLLTASLAVLAFAGISQGAEANKAFNGFNIGLVGGYVTQSSKLDVNTVGAVPAFSDSSDVGGQGFQGGLLLGWGRVFNCIHHFGVEATAKFASLDGKKVTNTIPAAQLAHKVKQNAQYDLSLRYGPVVSQKVLPFIKVGVSYGSWKSESSSVAIGSGSKNNNQIGFVVGAGAEFDVGHNFSVGAEYNYNYFKDFTYDVRNNAGVVVANVKTRPSSSAFLLRVKYSIG